METLNTKNILKTINQEAIMERYFPQMIVLGKKYANPFRDDQSPSCYFKYTSSGNLYFYDKAVPDSGGDCFKIVMLRYNITFIEALRKINEDFRLGLATGYYGLTPLREEFVDTSVVTVKPKRASQCQFKVQGRDWERIDYNYWYLKYGVSLKLLHKYNIIPVQSYSIRYADSLVFRPAYNYQVDTDPCYCYIFDEGVVVKLYRHLAKEAKFKWKSNVKNQIQGYSQLPETGDLLIIASSMKDALVLIANGYNAIAPQSETNIISSELYSDLAARFTKIIVCFDNDSTGITASNKIVAQYKCNEIILPNSLSSNGVDIKLKDCADFMAYFIETSPTITEARTAFKSLFNSLL